MAGGGDDEPTLGAIADEVSIDSQPTNLAAGPDGTFAFSAETAIYWVTGGRVSQVAQVPPFEVDDIAFAGNGSLLVAVGTTVWRYDPQGRGTLIAGRPGTHGFSGDGGPAQQALLNCPASVDVQGDGVILIADPCARRVRRIGPDFIISTVAGNGGKTRGAPRGDGGPATAAPLRWPDNVAALAGGGFVILDQRSPSSDPATADTLVRQVGPDGVIRTRAATPATALAAERDGTLLLVDWAGFRPRSVWVRRLTPDGRLETAVDSRDGLSIGAYFRCFGDCQTQVDSVAPASDGGLLVAAGGVIRYVPPPDPAILAVAVAPATRAPRSHLEVTLRLTRAADVHLQVVGGHQQFDSHVSLPAGQTVLPFPKASRPDTYDIYVKTSAGGQIATNYGQAIAGALPLSFARWYFSLSPKRSTCRRDGAWRVTCTELRQRRCLAETVRVLPGGAIASSMREAIRRRCRGAA